MTPIGRAITMTEPEKPEGERQSQAAPDKPSQPRPASKPPPKPSAPRPAHLDRRMSGKVARGRIGIDARIDLHGMTQAAAHRRLVTFLHEAQATGARLVLVITGKGSPDRSEAAFATMYEPERGVLRRAVPQWLNGAELRPFVVGFGEASRRHGGGGALYVQVRRRRG